MMTSDNTEYHVDSVFDGRYVDITNLKTPTDCEIVIAELQHNIGQIKASLEGGKELMRPDAARTAMANYEHKARMAVIKRDALLKARAEEKERTDAKLTVEKKFVQVARAQLAPGLFDDMWKTAQALG